MANVRKLIYGMGVNDLNGCFSYKNLKFYYIWHSMIRRCYSPKYHQNRPTYINCTLHDEWVYLSKFKKWFDENYIEEYQLDKDLLFPGNKVYGPNTCLFLSRNINSLFIFCNGRRGEYPLGIYFDCRDNAFKAKIRIKTGKNISKNFKNPIEGHFWYLEQKINVINQYLEEDHSEQIKTGLNRWKQLLTYHIDNKVIFDPDNINFELEI